MVDEANRWAETNVLAPMMSAEGQRPRPRPPWMARCRLLLISNSSHPGMGFLAHCLTDITDFLGPTRELLFIPYAFKDHDYYAEQVTACFAIAGISVRSLHTAPQPHRAVREASAFLVGGGNTFVLLKQLYDLGLLEAIRARVWDGVPYIGASAGANLATRGIHTANDLPVVLPPSLRALELVPFHIDPHYVDPDAGCRHGGGTSDDRIREFHDHEAAPVLGLRDGAALRVEGLEVRLIGTTGAPTTGARLFRRGAEPLDLAADTRLDELLSPAPGVIHAT